MGGPVKNKAGSNDASLFPFDLPIEDQPPQATWPCCGFGRSWCANVRRCRIHPSQLVTSFCYSSSSSFILLRFFFFRFFLPGRFCCCVAAVVAAMERFAGGGAAPLFLFRPNTYQVLCKSIEHIYMRPSRLKRYIE